MISHELKDYDDSNSMSKEECCEIIPEENDDKDRELVSDIVSNNARDPF